MKRRNPQDFSSEEFESVVALIRRDASLREDIEAITGQKIDGRTPRELFDLFRAIQGAAEVQAAVVRFGQAKRAVRQTRAELTVPAELPPSTAEYVAGLQLKVDEERRKRLDAERKLKAVREGKLLQLPAGSQDRAVSA